jgi:plasmid stability protein
VETGIIPLCEAPFAEVAMADISIRNVPQSEYDALGERAERHGRSLEEEVRHVLHEAAAEQLLVTELKRATAAADKTLRAAVPAMAGGRRPAGRRGVRYEPTPGRR